MNRREVIIREWALRCICPLTMEPKTQYEIGAVENLMMQGRLLLDAMGIIDLPQPAPAALADPSPQADAVRAVLGLMDKWQETAFKSDWESVDEDLFAAWDAYRAVTSTGTKGE